MEQTTRYNEYDQATGRMTELESNDPRLTARMPAAKVVEMPITADERKAAMAARFAARSR